MLLITCHNDKCQTPNFVIPLPNTETVIAYADDLELGKGAPTPAILNTPAVAARVDNASTFAPTAIDQGKGRQRVSLGLAAVRPLVDTDYLVVYCDSGHKNYVTFKI